MTREDELAAAQLAGLVGGHLNNLQKKMVKASSTDAGNRLDPRDFLPQRPNTQARPTTNNQGVVPQGSIIEPPKSRPAGSEIVGTEEINVSELMIDTRGMDKEMKQAILKHSNPSAAAVGPIPPQAPASNPQPKAQQPIPVNQPNKIIELLEEINKKLDLLLKRAKIQPRYKKSK